MDVVDAVNQWWQRGIDVDGWTDRRVDLMALMGIDAMFNYFSFLKSPLISCFTFNSYSALSIFVALCLYLIFFYHFVTHIIYYMIRTSC